MSLMRKLWSWKRLRAGLLVGAFVAACTAPAPLPTLLPTVTPLPPTATATATASPTPRPTATFTPEPTATPQGKPQAGPPPPQPRPALGGAGVPLPLQTDDLDWAAFAFVARAMNQTERGRHYLALYQQHHQEWLALQAADPAWAQRTHDLFKAWEPAAQALMYGQGDQMRLTPGLVAMTRAYLDDLAARGSPELAAAIRTESAYIPWGGLADATVNAAWIAILGAPPPPPAPPSSPPAATPVP